MRRKKWLRMAKKSLLQTKLHIERQAAAHTISFFLPSFHYLSSLSMNSEILELDWQRTQNVTEYPHVTRLLLTKLGIKLWSQLPILHSFTNLSLSQVKISCIYWSSNTHHIPKISLHIFIQCLIMLKTGHIIEFAHTVSFVNTSVKFLAILKPC